MVAPRTRRANFLGACISALSVLAFSLLLIRRDPLVFWNDDYQISILPVFDDVARSWREGQFPLLNPYSWVCGNLAGEFQYGTFSLFVNAAVVAVWQIFSQFAHQATALSIIHLIVLAVGGFVLARSRDLSLPLAIMVSLVAALNGWIICWGATDWFGALGAFAWIPWAWWACERALGPNVALGSSRWSEETDRPAANATKSRWKFLWPAPFVYLVITGGFPYTVVMLAVIVMWLTIRCFLERKSLLAPLPMLTGVALGFGFGAPAILALLAYVHGSAREIQPAASHWQWIVPPGALPGLILPSWTVNWADFSTRYVPHTGTELASGLVPPVALICAFFLRARVVVRRLRWELLLFAFVLILSMLPTTGVFRWSFRWLPLLHLILALISAESLRLLGGDTNGASRWRSPGTFAVILTIAAAVVTQVFGLGGTYAWPLTAVFLIIAAVWRVSESVEWHRLPADEASASRRCYETGAPSSQRRLSFYARGWIYPVVAFAALLSTYLCIPPNCGVPRYSFTESLKNPEPLDPARLYLSIYPPPEFAYRTEARPQPVGQIVRPGSAPMWSKLHFINGYSPIRPSGVARDFFFSIHGEIDSGVAYWLLYAEAGANGLLAQLGIDGLAIAQETWVNPGPQTEWELVTSTNEGRVFHRHGGPLPRVRSLPSTRSRGDAQYASANVTDIVEQRNSVSCDVEVPDGSGPALIAFSRPYFDGYVTTLDGKAVPVTSERNMFPVIELPPGSRGHLVLRYRPAWLVAGSLFAIGCGAIWLLGAILAALKLGR